MQKASCGLFYRSAVKSGISDFFYHKKRFGDWRSTTVQSCILHSSVLAKRRLLFPAQNLL